MSTPEKKAGIKRPAAEPLETVASSNPSSRLAPSPSTAGDAGIKLVILTSDVLLDGRKAIMSTIRKLFVAEGLNPGRSVVEILSAFSKGPRAMNDIFVEIGLVPKLTQRPGPDRSPVPTTPRKKFSDSAPKTTTTSVSFHVKHTPTGRIPSKSPTAERKSLSPVARRQAARPAVNSQALPKRANLVERYTKLIAQEPIPLYNGARELLARLKTGGLNVLVVTRHPSTVFTKIKSEQIPRDHIEAIVDCPYVYDVTQDPTMSRHLFSSNIAPLFGLSALPGDVNIKEENKTEDEDQDMKDALPPNTPFRPGKAIPKTEGDARTPTTPGSDPRSSQASTLSMKAKAKGTPKKSPAGGNLEGGQGNQKQAASGGTPTTYPTKPEPQTPTPTKPAKPAPGPTPQAAAEVLFVSCTPGLCATMGKSIRARTCWVNQLTNQPTVEETGIDAGLFDFVVGDLFQLADSILGEAKQEEEHAEDDAMDVDGSVDQDQRNVYLAVEIVTPDSESDSKAKKGQGLAEAAAAAAREDEEEDKDEEMNMVEDSSAAVAVAVPAATPTSTVEPSVDTASAPATAVAVPATAVSKNQAAAEDSDSDSEVIVVDPDSW